MKSSNTQVISTGQQQIDDEKNELADTEKKREQSEEDLSDTCKQVTADQAVCWISSSVAGAWTNSLLTA